MEVCFPRRIPDWNGHGIMTVTCDFCAAHGEWGYVARVFYVYNKPQPLELEYIARCIVHTPENNMPGWIEVTEEEYVVATIMKS